MNEDKSLKLANKYMEALLLLSIIVADFYKAIEAIKNNLEKH